MAGALFCCFLPYSLEAAFLLNLELVSRDPSSLLVTPGQHRSQVCMQPCSCEGARSPCLCSASSDHQVISPPTHLCCLTLPSNLFSACLSLSHPACVCVCSQTQRTQVVPQLFTWIVCFLAFVVVIERWSLFGLFLCVASG